MVIDTEKSVKKTDLEKRYNASRSRLNRMLNAIPGYKPTKSWYIEPPQLKLIISFYG